MEDLYKTGQIWWKENNTLYKMVPDMNEIGKGCFPHSTLTETKILVEWQTMGVFDW